MLQAHRPFFSSKNMSSSSQPQGLCICCPLPGMLFPQFLRWLAPFSTIKSQLKCHLLKERYPVHLIKAPVTGLAWHNISFTEYHNLWLFHLFVYLLSPSQPQPNWTVCSTDKNSLFICLVHHHNPSAMSDTVVQCLTQNRCSKYLLNKLTTMEGLAPRVSRLNIGMSIRRAVLGSLFRTNNLLPEVYEAISLSFSPTTNDSLKNNLCSKKLFEISLCENIKI